MSLNLTTANGLEPATNGLEPAINGKEAANLHDLSEPFVDNLAGQLFLNEAFKIIVEEVLCKGTDVKQKVL